MATRKDEDAEAKGFQIPIEDGSASADDTAASEARGDGATGTAGAAGGPAEQAEQAERSQAAEPAKAEQPAGRKPSDEGAAPEAGEAEGEPPAKEAAAEDDIVAEAEAVVEEAASAAGQLDEALKQASEWQDRYLRLHAEWDTYRRRTSEQRAEEKVRATEKLMENLLPVLDDFERTVAYAAENGEVGLLDGVKAVQNKLLDALVKSGLELIDPAGEPYDALEAQAVATVPDEEAFDETVSEVYQKGYKMGKKVLRPAMVTVTTGGPKRPKEAEEASD